MYAGYKPAMRISLVILCLSLLTSSPGCGQSARETRGGSITHVVVVWLKTPGDEAGRRRLIDNARSLQAIPGVSHVHTGRVVPSTRPVVDSSYDVALVMTMKDAATLKAYATHPVHVRFVEEHVKPLVERYRVYDFVTE
jgi:hypothetical protein